MLKTILFVLSMVLLSVPAMAAPKTVQLTAEWSFPVEAEAEITGYEIYDANNVVVISNIAKTARAVVMTITFDGKSPQAFYMRAVDATDPANVEYSGNSNVYVWSPAKKKIATTGSFTVH